MGRLTLLTVLVCCIFANAKAASKCPSQTVSFDFSSTFITELGKDFMSSEQVSCLDFSGNTIKKITPGAFDQLSNLTNLYLSHNNLESLKNILSFGDLPKVEILMLDHAKGQGVLYEDSIEIKSRFPAMRQLSLQGNKIRHIKNALPQPAAEDYLTTATPEPTVRLSTVRLSTVEASTPGVSTPTPTPTPKPVDVEVPFPKLEDLDLSHNLIERVEFRNLMPTDLMHLNLTDNRVLFFHMSQLRNLSTLLLDGNRLSNLAYTSPFQSSASLAGLKQLRYLSVARNNLKAVMVNAFDDTQELVHLNLGHNTLETIPVAALEKLTALRSMSLTKNALKVMPALPAMPELEQMDISYNMIKDVPSKAFNNAVGLRVLNLNNNAIEAVDASAFFGLAHLEQLDMSMNYISQLPEGWCSTLFNLKYLDLKGNAFATFEALSLSNTLPLKYLYFEENPLTHITSQSLVTLPKTTFVNLAASRKH